MGTIDNSPESRVLNDGGGRIMKITAYSKPCKLLVSCEALIMLNDQVLLEVPTGNISIEDQFTPEI